MKDLLCLLAIFCCLPSACAAQQVLQLNMKQAIEIATSPEGSASVQTAEAVMQASKARVSYARSLLFPAIDASIGESNLTRNLSAEGFNFPTGVPNFTIPDEVGPFNNFDARVTMSYTVFDLGAIRRSHGLRANLDAAKADITVRREVTAAQVAHDYLLVLRAESSSEAARAGVALSESLLKVAQDRADVGKATSLDITRAKLTLLTDRRKLTTVENEAAQARLQLLSDLGVGFATKVELTDHLLSKTDAMPDIEAAVATALQGRPELQVAQKHVDEARYNNSAVSGERIPLITASGDVGPLASVVTHTVGVSAKIPVFDGGRIRARHAETQAIVRQSEIQERDLRRKIELEVRRAHADLHSAAGQVEECQMALTLAADEVAEARRRFEAGVTGNAELAEAQAKRARAQDDCIGALFTWNQGRIDLARATGTMTAFTLN
ncbi:TolC family protein [Terriglobus albidus]|uniref:TolC family protein n=2 Tax=Terriglobus albidus TaxID=1592106 RepID=A0A5B9EGN7_9BACT|nr:TolC family protein [Terriglobus albidus]